MLLVQRQPFLEKLDVIGYTILDRAVISEGMNPEGPSEDPVFFGKYRLVMKDESGGRFLVQLYVEESKWKSSVDVEILGKVRGQSFLELGYCRVKGRADPRTEHAIKDDIQFAWNQYNSMEMP